MNGLARRTEENPSRSYELEFYVDDEAASRLRLDRPIRVLLRQD